MNMEISWGCFLLLWSGLLGTVPGLVMRCPSPGSTEPSYCSCSNTTISIRCDFKNKEDVVLTKELLAPYDNLSLDSAYVRVANATTVNVSSDFVQRWAGVSSAAFDVWHSGTVYLYPMPRSVDNATSDRARMFAGVGIVDCYIPEVPASFLRDRVRGAFRIKQSRVGVLRAGFLDNVREMRYIAVEDSVVGEVEGSVAAEGYVTLSQLDVHSWNGLILSNVSIRTLGPGAFNLTHKSDMELLTVQGCHLGQVAQGAFSATGDIQVNIKNNVFLHLERDALNINVTGNVYFNRNVMGAASLDALATLGCHNTSSIQNNTIFLSDPNRPAPNRSSAPFHASCGKPQLLMVLSSPMEVVMVEDTRPVWVLGATLALLLMTLAVGVAWSFRRHHPIFSRGRYPILHKGENHTTSLDNLPRSIELNVSREDQEEGTSGKDLDLACESQQDAGSSQFDADDGVAQSISSCESAAPFADSDDQQ